MSQVATYQFGTLDLRVVDLDGQPWFVAKDVATALGFTVDALRYHAKGSFQKDEKRVVKLPGFRGTGGLCLSESGLYKLIMRSDKPQARVFQDWVTRDVLPAIRKDGAYIQGEEKVATGELSEDDLVLKAIGILQRKVERLASEKAALRADNERLLPAAQVDQAVGQPSCFLVSLQLPTGLQIDLPHVRIPSSHDAGYKLVPSALPRLYGVLPIPSGIELPVLLR